MRHGRLFARSALLGAALAPLVFGGALEAQDADFLFHRPWVSVGIRGGYSLPNQGSEVFAFIKDELTIETSDLYAAALGAELAIRATERLDVALGVDWSRSRTRSEPRGFEATDGLPIEQITTFQRVPITLTVKGYLFERGRSVSRFAWIPARWSPYVGAGFGALRYSFEQDGEFVDVDSCDPVTEECDIFRDFFVSEGTTPVAHVLAGADISITPRFVITGEARYSWARSEMSRDFVGFDKIDLAGLQMTAGVSVRF